MKILGILIGFAFILTTAHSQAASKKCVSEDGKQLVLKSNQALVLSKQNKILFNGRIIQQVPMMSIPWVKSTQHVGDGFTVVTNVHNQKMTSKAIFRGVILGQNVSISFDCPYLRAY